MLTNPQRNRRIVSKQVSEFLGNNKVEKADSEHNEENFLSKRGL